MSHKLAQLAITLSLSTVLGCESSVLVNNRPDSAPGSGSDATTASDNTQATSADRTQAYGSTTQPSQRIETKNTTIQSD